MHLEVPDELLLDAEQTLDDAIELARTDPLYLGRDRRGCTRLLSVLTSLPLRVGEAVYWLTRHHTRPTGRMKTVIFLGKHEQPWWMSDELHSTLDRLLDFSVGSVTLSVQDQETITLPMHQLRRELDAARREQQRELAKRQRERLRAKRRQKGTR